jgi:hypothetical protein
MVNRGIGVFLCLGRSAALMVFSCLVLTGCGSVGSRVAESTSADENVAVSSLLLDGDIYGTNTFLVSEVYARDCAGKFIQSTRRIEITRHGRLLYSIPLPPESYYDFRVLEIAESPVGFDLAVMWNYYGERTLEFNIDYANYKFDRLDEFDVRGNLELAMDDVDEQRRIEEWKLRSHSR